MAVKVPIFNLEVANNPTPQPYKSASAPAAAFDSTMGLDDLGKGSIYASKALDENQEQKDKTAADDLFNQFELASQDILNNKDNGYLTKSGKAALDSTQSTLENLEKTRDSIINSTENNRTKAFAMQSINKRYIGIEEAIKQHETEQNQKWKSDVLNNTIDLQTQRAIINKYNTNEIYKAIGNIRTAIADKSGESDPELLKQLQDKATSNIHLAIIEGRIGDKALNAKEYFEAHKNEIDPSKWDEAQKLINTNDADVRSRLLADQWLSSGLTEEQAYEKAHSIQDLDLRDATESKVNALYGKKRELEKQVYNDKLDSFWNTFESNPDINNIPAWMDGKDRITAKNFALGGARQDDNTYVDLTEMSMTNADAFVKINLNEYRDRLTKTQFDSFKKRQLDIIAHGYTTLTPDDKATKKVISSVLDTYGKWNVPNKQNVATIMQNIVNEEERRTGQKYSEEELKTAEQRIAGWLGYSKDASSVKVINDNETKADFYKGLANDVTYFEKVHKRQPDQKEFQSLLYQRANYAVQDRNNKVYESIKNTAARPKETQAVTYFAHDYIPNLSKKLGTDIKIAPDQIFNPKSKDYKSWHNVNGISHAVDVGMTGRPNNTKFNIVDNILKDFPEAKIGTSDPVILRRFEGKNNVIDLREFDKKHGTNHADHVHVTLNIQGNDAVVAHNQSTVRMKAPNGRIYAVPIGQVAEYEKIGGVKI